MMSTCDLRNSGIRRGLLKSYCTKWDAVGVRRENRVSYSKRYICSVGECIFYHQHEVGTYSNFSVDTRSTDDCNNSLCSGGMQ
jgi:hypothetical protein